MSTNDMPTRPEKVFNITIQIFTVPQKELQKWLDDVAAIEYETAIDITEVDPTKTEDPPE